MRYQPKGPLFTLRLSRTDVEELRQWLRDRLRHADPARIDARTAAAFCVFAAEWWRRNHGGGPWRWRGIQQALQVEDVAQDHLRSWTDRGLRELGRPLVRLDGTNLYLVSLATEGGLPLKLVQRQGNRLHAFFTALFEHLEETSNSAPTAEELTSVARNRATLLPRSLRQPPVFHLAGRLTSELWPLVLEVADRPHPLRWLDQARPGWRDRLPIQLEDEVARSFLERLVVSGGEIVRHGEPLDLACSLRHDPDLDAWRLIRRLSAPERMSAAHVRSLFGEHAKAPVIRLRLLAASTETIAAMLRRHRDDFFVEPIGGARVRDDDGHVELEVMSRAGAPVRETLPGALPLGPLPWTFRKRKDRWVLAATGSCRVADEVVRVALPPDAKVVEGDVEPVGELARIGRRLVDVRGRVAVEVPDGLVEIRAAEPPATQDLGRYRWVGARLPSARSRRPVYRGWPRLRREDGAVRDGVGFEVRGPTGWQPHPSVFGDVQVRVVTPERRLALVQRVQVVPEDLRIEVEVGQDCGRVVVDSSQLVDAGIASVPGLHVVRCRDGRRVVLEVTPAGARPATLALRLELKGGRPLDLEVPCPLSLREFVGRDGAPLPDGTVVHVGRLGGVRVQVAEPQPLCHYLEARLSDGSKQRTFAVGTRGTLCELDLRSVQDDLRSMLAQSVDLDVEVDLRLFTPGVQRSRRRIRVRRYDWCPEPDRERGDVVLADEDVGEDTVVEVRPFASLAGRERLPRLRAPHLPGMRWFFEPGTRDPGAWLVTARDGVWHRARPMLWTVPGATVHHGLRAAYEIRDRSERSVALRRALDAIADDVDHADWSVLDDALDAAVDVPPTTFDVLDELVSHRALALAALRLTWLEASRRTKVLAALDDLPLCWHAVPRAVWFHAFDVLHDAFEADEPGEGLEVVSEATGLLSEIVELDGFVLHWCRARGLDTPRGLEPGYEAPPAVYHDLLEARRTTLDRMVRSHDHEVQWPLALCPSPPASLQVRHGFGWPEREAIFQAPASAVHFVATSPTMPGLDLSRAWRTAFDFDPDYFQQCWRNTLAVALGREAR